MNPVVAVIAQGQMGAGVGGRLAEKGARVITSLAGRSADSAARAAKAGMTDASDEEIAAADFILSIVPPKDALALAQRLAPALTASNAKPVYVECNAVSPPTAERIGGVVAQTGCPFVDGGIIGGPPKPKGNDTPALYVSGPAASRVTALSQHGIDVRVLEGPLTAASALKMSYAGITKGCAALGAGMFLAAIRGGSSDALYLELQKSQPTLLAWFDRYVPTIHSKAYRWVAEMEEIADFAGDKDGTRDIYEAVAKFYTHIADDFDAAGKNDAVLNTFLKKPAP